MLKAIDSLRENCTVRIGGASGFWGDSSIATPQLLKVPGLQYLVYDYLAETTMAILARARTKNPDLGYATDFVTSAMAPHLAVIQAKGVRVVSNAGGLNPQACAEALMQEADEQGLEIKVAVVTGDDVSDLFPELRDAGLKDMYSGDTPPATLSSANAYTGAQGIARALDMGADIVITGRCVDSAVVLGVLAHEFQWSWNDWDRLAAGTLAGHVIECGAQATGGLFTDWHLVPDWANMGYPVIDCEASGAFTLSKPEHTGGLIHPGAVAEQILYEVGDPSRYVMPDVCCDFRYVTVEPVDAEKVRVSGARGTPPSDSYKANGTYIEGFQIQTMMAIRGINAKAKAQKTAEALLARTRTQLRESGFADYSEVSIELLGTESLYGPNAQELPTREVILRIAARHPLAKGLSFLRRECASAGTSMGPGTRTSFTGRADIQPVFRVFSFLVPKNRVTLRISLNEENLEIAPAAVIPNIEFPPPSEEIEAAALLPSTTSKNTVTVPLIRLAWARSGDKGDNENIGVIARRPEFYPVILKQLTAQRVHKYFSHLVLGDVHRYEVPGLNAVNFLLLNALDGGGVCSLRSDPLGKSFAQMLLDLQIEVPPETLEL